MRYGSFVQISLHSTFLALML